MKLELKDVSKFYDQKQILKDINIKLENIHSLGILGPSGGGKSTLLRLLAGIEKVDSGSIVINNTLLKNEEKFLNAYRKTVGVVFQAYNLFPNFSAEKNVTLPLEKVHNMSHEQALSISNELFTRFLLMEHRHKKPNQLSGGQQQRVAIIRALASTPAVMFFDEPTSALDPEITGEVLQAIYDVITEKKDMVLVTHHIEFAKKACDYLLFIAEGQILEHGPAEEFWSKHKTGRLAKFLEYA